MLFKDRFDKMTRSNLEKEIRKFKDFSRWTRKEKEEELRVILPDINLNEFSDQGLEELLRKNYSFDEYDMDDLRKEARRHDRFKDWSREELEEEYEQLEKTKEAKYKTIRWIIISVLCALFGYYYGSIHTQLAYLEQRTEQLQQELKVIDYQNDILEDKVDTLSDTIDLIIIYITSDDVKIEKSPETSEII